MLKLTCLTALALGLGACMPSPPPYLAAPADPSIQVRDPASGPVTADVRTFPVKGPGDWRELNRRVGPRPSHQGDQE